MIELFTTDFLRNALIEGILVSIACGIIGSLVVVNRIVFLAGGIAHAAYGGVGLAFYAGLPVLPCTLGFSIVTSFIMGLITLNKNERSDTVIGVMWAGGMALGIILLDITPGYNVNLMSYLFGSILTASSSDIIFMLVLDLIILILITLFYNHFLIISFDMEYAVTRGIPVRFFHFLLLMMVAISVVMIIRVVGLILVIALLTIPPYISERFSGSLSKMIFLSIILSVIFCMAGLYLSYQFDITSGASIIAVATVVFFIVTGIDKLMKLNKKLH
jgi:zinc transport system permease protein